MCRRRLLKFLFIKRTLNFLSVIISYFICHWNGQLNHRNLKNLFRPRFSVTFIKQIFFLVILTLSPLENFEAKVLPHIMDINCSTPYFLFPYNMLPSESYLSMNESYYCTDPQVSQVHQYMFLYY